MGRSEKKEKMGAAGTPCKQWEMQGPHISSGRCREPMSEVGVTANPYQQREVQGTPCQQRETRDPVSIANCWLVF